MSPTEHHEGFGPFHRAWWTKKRVLLAAGGAGLAWLLLRRGSPSTTAGSGSAPPAQATLQVITQRPVVAKPGATYYGRADVGWPLSMAVSASAVASKLRAMGFTNVAAYTDASSLPASWPADQRTGNVFASGTYAGTQMTAINLPSQVQEVWTYA